MSVSVSELKRLKCSSGDYKLLFTAEPQKRPKRLNALIDVLSTRRREGIEGCLRDHRALWAIDIAYDSPVSTSTSALIQALLSKKLTDKETYNALASYGLKESDLFLNVRVKGDNGVEADAKILNPPIFYEVVVPVVKAYVTTRCASLYNERDTSPLLQYTPLHDTDKNRVICEIVTGMVDKQSGWYGYPCYLRQAILQMLKYGTMLSFATEEWHCEEQLVDGKAVVQREGIRYVMPHPSRMFHDQFHPLWTINTGTGCEYAGFWDTVRAGDVLDNPKYWNRSKITWGTNWFGSGYAGQYFKEAFPCRMEHPVGIPKNQDREAKAAFYQVANDRDTAMFLTTVFWKLIPKDWGLGDYRYPVWHRFVIASDDTIVWAEPCAYDPVWYMGYDVDDQAGTPSSMATECVPWQGHLSNIMSEMVRTAKKNLADFFAFDTNLVDPKVLEKMNLLGDKKYAGPQFIPFDSKMMQRGGLDWKKPFERLDIGYHSIVEIQQCLQTALTIMERVLGITAQETGSVAAHYQSKTEVDITKNSGDTRKRFTGSGVDDGTDAWKRQLFDGNKAYRDDGVTAQVSAEIPNLEQYLEELGFKVATKGMKKYLVKGSKKTLKMEGFARSNLGPEQQVDPAASQIIFQTLGAVAQNPEVFQQVGAGRVVKLLEQAARLAGAPRDFDLTTDSTQGDASAITAQITPVLKELQTAIMNAVTTNFAQPVAEALAKAESQIAQLEAQMKQIAPIAKVAETQMQKVNVMAQEAAAQEQIDQAAFAAEERRKEEAHQANLRRKQDEAAIKVKTDMSVAAITVQQAQHAAQVDMTVKATESAVKTQALQQQTAAKVSANAEITASKVEAAKKLSDAKVAAAKKAAKAKPKPAAKK